MTDEPNATGNEAPNGGEPRESEETHTPEPESREAGQGEEYWKRKYLNAKSAEEKLNRIERERAEQERQDSTPAVRDDVEGTPDETGFIPYTTEWHAAKGDAVARDLLLQRRAMELRDQLSEIKDDEERKEVRAHFLKNQRRLGDIAAARAEVREKKLAEENAALHEKLKRYQARESPDVIDLTDREVPASKAQITTMTFDEWDAKVAKLDLHEARQLESQIGKTIRLVKSK